MTKTIPVHVILTFWFCLISLPVSAGITEGIQHLSNQVQQNGSYDNGTGVATTYQNTSETLTSFHITNQNQPQEIASALQFLQNQPFKNAEYLSRLITAQVQHSQVDSTVVNQLKSYQNQDSGFGELNGYDSSILDTAIALEALAVAGESENQVLGLSVSFLLNRQNADGGWSDGLNNSNVYTTALALNALSYYQHIYSMDVAISTAQNFLYAQTVNDVWSETYQSALSLKALINTLGDLAPIANNLSALRAQQQTNGSWDNDVYSTALVLHALHLSTVTPTNSKLASLSGTIIDEQTATGLNNVTVTLSGPSQKTVVTTQQGDFNFQDLIPGNYSISINLNGYSSVTANTLLNPGQQIDFGLIQLLASGTANEVTIRGVITDAKTDLPIPGVSVNLQNHASVFTDASGAYLFSQIQPDVVVLTATINGYSKATGMSDLNSGGLFVFSPALTPVTQPVTAIKGQIQDADTGLPLPNVTIKVSVATTATTTTDSSGQYLLENLQPGDVIIEASLPGYLSVTTVGILYQDNVLLFSPALQPVSTSNGQNNTGATGLIIDADTLLPLENVTVDAYYGLNYSGPSKVTVQTDDTGQFTLMGITESPVNFIFSLSGYGSSAVSLTAQPFTITDLGEIQLQQLAPPLPDLIINNVDNSTTQNDPVTLELTGFISSEIGNTGTAVAQAGTQIIAFYDSNQNQTFDPISDQLLGQIQTANPIQANEKQQLTIPVQGFLPYRDALIHVWIDSVQSVIESDESNNLLTSAAICNQKPITTLPPPPNITVAPGYSLEIYATKVINQQGPIQLAMDSADNLYFAPGSFGAAYTIPEGTPGPASQRTPMTFGDTTTSDTDGVVVDSQDNIIVSGNRILKFAPDGALIWSRSCPAGNIQLSGIDQNDAIYVGSLGSTFCKFSTDGDRQILGPFPTPHSPNFAPDGTLYLIGVRPPNIAIVDPDTGATQDLFLVNFRANQLAFDCDGFIYTSQISDPSGIRHIYKIDPVTKQFTSLASGTGFTNPSGFVFDSEGNLFISDQTTKTIYKLTFEQSSCRKSNIDLTASKLTLQGALSSSNTLTALIGNGGLLASPTTTARLYEGDPDNGGIQLGSLSVPTIAANNSQSIVFTNISLTGGQALYVRIDDDQQITECREDNNIARLAAPDLKPDLIVSAFDTTAVNTDFFTLAVMGSLDATITNQGTLSTQSASTVLAFYDKDKNGIFDQAIDSSLGQIDIINSLQIGESQTFVIPINGNAPFRNAPITLWVDHLQQIDELIETNNTQITNSQCIASSGQVSSDLTVSLAQIIDNGTLQPWSFSVRIGNAGTLSTPDQIKISFYEGLPSQGGLLLGSKNISPIESAEFINLQIDGITNFSNTRELYVIADENNVLDECDETNNTLLGATAAATLAQIIVSTDQPSYPANTPVLLQSTVTNSGSATAPFTAQLQIEDSAGVIIQQFSSIQTGTLAGGDTFVFNQTWDTLTFLTGTYQLKGSVFSLDGNLLDQSSTPFNITGSTDNGREVSLRTTTDKAQYHTSATVQLQNLIQNLTSNRIIEQAVLDITVTNPSGLTVFSETVNAGQMLAGASQQIIRPFNFIAAPVGLYTVNGVLKDAVDNQILATDQAQYTVSNNLLFSISGNTQVSIPELDRGQINHCTDTITNQSSLALTGLPIRQLLANITDGLPITSHDLTLDLADHSTQTLQRDIDTHGFSAGVYACIIQAQIKGSWTTLANDTFILNLPPIEIEAQLDIGDRGRLLVLLDDESKQCNGYTQFSIETVLLTPLTANSTVTATLYDAANLLIDQETGLIDNHLIDQQPGSNGINLIIEDNAPTQITLSITSATLLGGGYKLVIDNLDAGITETYSSGLIPTNCSQSLAIGDLFGDSRLINFIPLTAANDPLGPNHTPDLTSQRIKLENLLTQAGWSYTLTSNKDDFTQELRSGAYLTYLLVSEQIKLDESVQKELREAVYRGEGLIEAGSHDQRQGRIDAALGVKFSGKHSSMQGFSVNLNPQLTLGEADFQLNDRTLRANPEGATVLGTFIDQAIVTNEPAITSFNYGQGRSLYIGFDIAAEAALPQADPLFDNLLLEALDNVHPTRLSAILHSTYPIRLTLNNLGIATPGQAIMTLPPNVSILDSGLAAVNGQTLTWPFDLAAPDLLILDAWLQLPALPLQITTLIQSGSAVDYIDQASLTLEITPEARVSVDAVSDQANAFTSKAYKQVKKYLNWAQQDSAAGQWEDALSALLRASDALIPIDTPESQALRVEVAKAIRSVSINLN